MTAFLLCVLSFCPTLSIGGCRGEGCEVVLTLAGAEAGGAGGGGGREGEGDGSVLRTGGAGLEGW